MVTERFEFQSGRIDRRIRMAKYTFQLACAKDVYTTIATGVSEISARLPVAGRLIVQDAADTDPSANDTGYVYVKAEQQIDLAVTGLEVCYMPQGVDTIVEGIKK